MVPLEKIIKDFDARSYNPPQWVIIGVKNREGYILVQENNESYVLKPINRLAYKDYETDIGYIKHRHSLKNYLMTLSQEGFKFYALPKLSMYFDLESNDDYEVYIVPQVEINVIINGKITKKPLNIKAAKRLGIIE